MYVLSLHFHFYYGCFYSKLKLDGCPSDIQAAQTINYTEGDVVVAYVTKVIFVKIGYVLLYNPNMLVFV